MAVGLPMKTTYANGDVYSASDVNDITGTVNLIGQTNNFYAGKNKIINGDFGIWQRGTSFTLNPGDNFTADRWNCYKNAGTITASQQTFTPGTAPVSGYEGTYFLRYGQTGSGTATNEISTRLEDVRLLAGQTVTFSFWAKASTAISLTPVIVRRFGTGGSSADTAISFTATGNLTTSWVRYVVSGTMPTLTGKTIGTGSYLQPTFQFTSATTTNIDIWGVQLESGSTATAFQTATGSIQGELAACQRYYWRANTIAATAAIFGSGSAASTTVQFTYTNFPVEMRVKPTAIDNPTVGTNFVLLDGASNSYALTALTFDSNQTTTTNGTLTATVASGLTQFRPYAIRGAASTAYIGWSAEL